MGYLRAFTFDKDSKFISHFWSILGTNLCFSSAHPHPPQKKKGANWSGKQEFRKYFASFSKRKAKTWDTTLSHAKFAYNQFPNGTTQQSLLEIIFGMNPTNVIDLIPIPHLGQVGADIEDSVQHIKSIHD